MISFKGEAADLVLLFNAIAAVLQQSGSRGTQNLLIDYIGAEVDRKAASPPESEVYSVGSVPSAPGSMPPVNEGDENATSAETFWGVQLPDSSSPVPLSTTDELSLQGRSLTSLESRRAQVQDGGVAWYHIVSSWSTNFGTEGEQPDRAKILVDTLTDQSVPIYAFLRSEGGLTQAVRQVAPSMSRRQSRLIAENIASVSSAMGIGGIADLLEYSKEYRKLED